jgi:hypothetical protein
MKILNTYAPTIYNASNPESKYATCLMYVLAERGDKVAVYMGICTMDEAENTDRKDVSERIAHSGTKASFAQALGAFPGLTKTEYAI